MSIRYPISFRAAILEKNNSPLVMDTVTFDGPLEPGQVLVKIHYTGICGKQIEEIKGVMGKDPYLPHMLGHEGAGIVEDVGPGVKKVVPGDHVIMHWKKGSGIDAGTPFYHRKGERVNAGWITTFNEYGVVPENRVTKIPKGSDLFAAPLFGCALTTGVSAVLNDAKARPGDSIAICGTGGVGLFSVQAAAMIRCFPIIAVDINESALALAKKLGATHTLNPAKCDFVKEIIDITEGKGAKHVLIIASNPQFTEKAVNASSIPGEVLFLAVPPKGSTITVDTLSIHRERFLRGSTGGGSDPDRDIPTYWELFQKGLINVKDTITKVVDLEDINEGIDSIMSGQRECPGRCIVRMVKD